MGVTALDQPGRNAVVIQHLHPVNRGILHTVPAGEDDPGGEVLPGIPGEVVHDRDAGEIGFLHGSKLSFFDNRHAGYGILIHQF